MPYSMFQPHILHKYSFIQLSLYVHFHPCTYIITILIIILIIIMTGAATPLSHSLNHNDHFMVIHGCIIIITIIIITCCLAELLLFK